MATADEIQAGLQNLYDKTLVRFEDRENRIEADVVALKAQVAALQGTGGSIDLKPLTDALTSLTVQVTTAAADIASVKRRIEKDLAP